MDEASITIENLRNFLKGKKIQQKEFARKLKVSADHLSKIMRGKLPINERMIESINWLISMGSQKIENSPLDDILLSEWVLLSNESKYKVLGFIESLKKSSEVASDPGEYKAG